MPCSSSIKCISIHAPSRERLSWIAVLASAPLFQSTLPRGSDILIILMVPSLVLFQSTLPRGSDRVIIVDNDKVRISIHAPSRERLRRGLLLFLFIYISIHAPSRERRRRYLLAARGTSISIHAPSRERPFAVCYALRANINFNPRSLAGATAYCRCVYRVPTDFNPRSLAGATD